MALNAYTIALLTAIQNGTAYIVPTSVDKKGVIGKGKVHFPGEENYQIQSGRAMINASAGVPFSRPNLTTSRSIEGVTYDPNSRLSITYLPGGTEGTFADITLNVDNNNKVLPAKSLEELVTIRIADSSGPTGFSKLATALFPVVANIALPGIGTAFSAINSIAQGADVGDVLKSVAINQGLSALGNAAAPEVDLNAATSGFQDVYGGALPIEDVAAAFDTAGPLADTTAGMDTAFVQDMSQGIESLTPQVPETLDTAFLQDMSQGIQPVAPPENPFLAGMEETTATEGAGVAGAQNPTGTYEGGANYLSGMEETAATEGAGVAGADNPTGTTVTVPESTQEATNNLTPKQIYQLLKLGAGLFGGAGALTAAAKGLTGGTGALGGLVGPSMPSIQAPTPFTGTYSGMNPYDAAYFQQVQQNYNRLFPTTPANIAGPLESWYQTKYVPDTTISNKLFGV